MKTFIEFLIVNNHQNNDMVSSIQSLVSTFLVRTLGFFLMPYELMNKNGTSLISEAHFPFFSVVKYIFLKTLTPFTYFFLIPLTGEDFSNEIITTLDLDISSLIGDLLNHENDNVREMISQCLQHSIGRNQVLVRVLGQEAINCIIHLLIETGTIRSSYSRKKKICKVFYETSRVFSIARKENVQIACEDSWMFVK